MTSSNPHQTSTPDMTPSEDVNNRWQTRYRDDYQPKESQHGGNSIARSLNRARFEGQKKHSMIPADDDHFQTSMKNHYVPLPHSVREPQKVTGVTTRPTSKPTDTFIGITTNRQAFKPHPGHKVRAPMPDPMKVRSSIHYSGHITFDAVTTHQEMHVDFGQPERVRPVVQDKATRGRSQVTLEHGSEQKILYETTSQAFHHAIPPRAVSAGTKKGAKKVYSLIPDYRDFYRASQQYGTGSKT